MAAFKISTVNGLELPMLRILEMDSYFDCGYEW